MNAERPEIPLGLRSLGEDTKAANEIVGSRFILAKRPQGLAGIELGNTRGNNDFPQANRRVNPPAREAAGKARDAAGIVLERASLRANAP